MNHREPICSLAECIILHPYAPSGAKRNDDESKINDKSMFWCHFEVRCFGKDLHHYEAISSDKFQM